MNQNSEYRAGTANLAVGRVTSAVARLWRDRPCAPLPGISTAARRGLTRPTWGPDGDGITNLDEYLAGTSPVRPNGMNFGGTHKSVTLASTAAPKTYDVYYRAPGGTKWRRISSGAPGQNAFNFVNPNQSAEGDFIFLDAKDSDGDGLSDGYENWFTYDVSGSGTYTCNNEQRSVRLTCPSLFVSNDDRMTDGWKVAYGLNPMDATGDNDPEYTVQGDSLSSEDKHNAYYLASAGFDASYDPLKLSNSADVRPVVTIAEASSTAFNAASFTITRDVGSAINIQNAPALVVYYAVGGTLVYGVDYVLDPAPLEAHYPNAFAIEIPHEEASVALTALLIRDSMPIGDKNLSITLTPYGELQ